ncbi:MAG: type II toxin-antitoxin system RelE/ParE family toxin [Gemmataceae bacterium]
MKRYRYSLQAEADLDEITDYFSDRSPAAGLRFLNAFEKRCRLLAAFPRTGRLRPELGSEVRSAAVGNYIVFFREAADGIDVLRVLHGARDASADMIEDSE